MWIIEYQYKAHDGSTVRIAKAMKDSQPVTIGRSDQNTLHIKNDRSISRKHIQFEWIRSNKMFTVNNFGKVTIYQDKYLKVGEIISFNVADIQFPLILQLGTTSIQVSIKKISLNIITSNESRLKLNSDQFKLYDIGIDTILDFHYESSTRSFMIQDETISSLTKLCALIVKIPLVSKEFIFELLNELEKGLADFNTLLAHLLKRTRIFQKNPIDSIRDITIIYLNEEHNHKKELLDKLIECVKEFQGSIKVFEDNEKFESYLQLRNSLKNIIILKHPQRIINNKILAILGNTSEAKIYTADEFINELKIRTFEELCIKNLELNHDIKSHSVDYRVNDEYNSIEIVQDEANNNLAAKKYTRSLEEPTEPSPIPVKKKRLTRRKIQALNPLDFFAGGSQSSQITKLTNHKSKNEEKSKSIKNNTQTSEITKDKFSQAINNPISAKDEDEIREANRSESIKNIINDISDTNSESKLTDKKSPTKIETYDQDTNSNEKITKESSLNNNLLRRNFVEQSADIEEMSDRIITSPINYSFKNTVLNNMSEITNNLGVLKNQPKKRKLLGTKDLKEKENEEKEDVQKKIKVKDGQESISKPNITLVKTIQSAKTKEITKYRNNLVQIEPDELTEEAINKFSNMALIEANSNLVKAGKLPKEMRLEKGDYAGRKNFKKFVKRWPCGSLNGDDSLTNSVHMLIRQFVETRPYSIVDRYLQKDSSNVGEMINERFASTNNESFHKKNNNERNSDDFENEYLSLEINKDDNNIKNNSHNNVYGNNNMNIGLFVNESEDEDIWIEPKFKVYNSNNNMPNVTYSLNDQETNSGINILPSNKKAQSNTLKDDSDDSDEGPRFQFKSRKKK